MKKANLASTYFANHYNCAQSAFVPFATDVGISEDQALKVACAFGGGMGRQQLTCGAVTGALMAIGMKYGMGADDPEDKKLETYDLTRRFFEEFIKLNGTANCRELLEDLNMNDPADSQVIKERDMHNTHCNKYVQDAVNIAEAIINRKKG